MNTVAAPPLSVVSVTVFADRLVALVRVRGPMKTSAYPGLARAVLDWLPSLATHACHNPGDTPFELELPDTELAHLAEHVALDLIRRAGVRGRLRGDTSWDFERDGAGVFSIALDCPDDAVALGALKAAVEAVNVVTSGGQAEDAQEVALRLRSLRGSAPEPKPRTRRRDYS